MEKQKVFGKRYFCSFSFFAPKTKDSKANLTNGIKCPLEIMFTLIISKFLALGLMLMLVFVCAKPLRFWYS